MEKTIEIGGKYITYIVSVSRKARSVRLVIDGSRVILTRPWLVPEIMAVGFLRSKANWIQKHLDAQKTPSTRTILHATKSDYDARKQHALKYFTDRTGAYNMHYKFQYKKISIRRQSSLWGSCSRRGNLQFNYLLLDVPLPVSDYVVVHELCHLRQPNHSRQFWQLVEEIVPNHKALRKQLRGFQIEKK